MPTLAALGPFLSLTPGAAGAPYAYRVLIAVGLLPALAALLRPPGLDLRRSALLGVTVMAAGWGSLGLLWTPDLTRGGRQLVGLLLSLAGAWVAIGLARRSPSALTAFRYGYLCAATVMLGLGIWQYRGGKSLWEVTGQPFNFSGNPLIGTFVNPNNYAAFILCCLGPILALLLSGPVLVRIWALLLVPGLSWALLESTSRAGVIGLVVMVGLGLSIAAIRMPRTQVPILLTALFGGVGAWLLIGPQLRGAVDASFERSSSASDQLRVQLSGIAWRYFLDSGGLGIGPGGFPARLAADGSVEVSRILPAHNTFLEMAAEYGLPVVLPFAVLLGGLLAGYARVRTRRADGRVEARRIEMLGCLIAVGVAALVASSVIADPSWWLLIGYLVVLTPVAPSRPDRPVSGDEPTPSPHSVGSPATGGPGRR